MPMKDIVTLWEGPLGPIHHTVVEDSTDQYITSTDLLNACNINVHNARGNSPN